MKVLVCGSRQWHDRAMIRGALKREQRLAERDGEEFVVIHGHCPDGADLLADQIATDELGLILGETLHRVKADWKRHGKAAGPIRNQRMLDQHDPDLVLAFRVDGKSSGTDDMIKRARKANVPVRVHTPRLTPDAT